MAPSKFPHSRMNGPQLLLIRQWFLFLHVHGAAHSWQVHDSLSIDLCDSELETNPLLYPAIRTSVVTYGQVTNLS